MMQLPGPLGPPVVNWQQAPVETIAPHTSVPIARTQDTVTRPVVCARRTHQPTTHATTVNRVSVAYGAGLAGLAETVQVIATLQIITIQIVVYGHLR